MTWSQPVRRSRWGGTYPSPELGPELGPCRLRHCFGHCFGLDSGPVLGLRPATFLGWFCPVLPAVMIWSGLELKSLVGGELAGKGAR